ncbi:serine/threonine-protein kinase [Spongisporangium articulatum]|uniref:non-specific serine/threonine protein kinase n=1 Tax=Spongisporangium articulatum TaxID=3362603 RepID=A0ABW8AI61_9ACTN
MITQNGLRLGDRYTLEERLAVGGMGEVWTARDDKLNRPVAVKVLRVDLAPEQSFQQRFRAEARTAAMLSHGGIAAVFDYGEVDGSAYLVMELVPGEPLSAMIARQGALGTDTTLQIIGQAARALHAAHRHGVVHRDIKPANLMVTPELRVKVTDFGIARPRDHEPLTATGQVMGTAHYLAPELARGEVASPLSDVYALGVVAYECLAGWRPFEGDNQVAVATAHLQDEPPALPTTIPAPVRDLVMLAMSKDKHARPQGANELARLVEDLRLRGLAGDYSGRSTTPAGGWPADAETPPRGGRRPAVTAAEGGTVVGLARAVGSEAPGSSTGVPVNASGFPDPALNRQPPSRRTHPPTMQQPALGDQPRSRSEARGPKKRPLRASTTPRRTGLAVPLVALVVLVAIVLIGTIVGTRLGAAPPALNTRGHGPDTGVARQGFDVEGSDPLSGRQGWQW